MTNYRYLVRVTETTAHHRFDLKRPQGGVLLEVGHHLSACGEPVYEQPRLRAFALACDVTHFPGAADILEIHIEPFVWG